jgi:hypothetical protein
VTAPVSYSLMMSGWYPEPRSFDRWIVRHRIGIRVGIGLFVVLGVCWMVYSQSSQSIGPIVMGSLFLLMLSWKVPRSVEKYDSAQHQGPNAK